MPLASPRRPARPPAVVPAPPTPHERFLHADRYRADREWKRYEGTAQRDLFRELRERFLVRHAGPDRWTLDLGSGPGRFTRFLGGPGSTPVALDLSRASLQYLAEVWPRAVGAHSLPDRVRGDAVRPPFAAGRFGTVAVLGNTVGFAGAQASSVLKAAESLVAPGGVLLVEIAPGPGERSRYLARLPAGSVARLLRSPTLAVIPRIDREGFSAEPARKAKAGAFLRLGASELARELTEREWTVREIVAVAPALGPDAERLESVQRDPKSWDHLLQVEEELGRRPERWAVAAAVLLAVGNKASNRWIK